VSAQEGREGGGSPRNSQIIKISTGMVIIRQALSLYHHRILRDTISTNHENTKKFNHVISLDLEKRAFKLRAKR
jgi:hypothetical protein